jgi:hypothetical protein
MSGRLPARIVLLVLALAGGAAAFQWWNSPARRIARVLDAVASALSYEEPGTGLDALSAIASLQPYLAPEISLETGAPAGPIVGRQEVAALAGRLRATTPMMRVRWFDPDIEVETDSRATVRATMQVTSRNMAGEDVIDVHPIEAWLEEREGEWVVVKARREADREAVQ